MKISIKKTSRIEFIITLHIFDFRSWRGRNFNLTIRFTCQVRQSTDDVSITTHTNETMGCLRARILRIRVGTNGATQNYRLHLFANSDLIEASEDRRVVTHFGLRDRSILSAQLVPLAGQSITAGSHIPSSPESTSGSSLGGSPKLVCAGTGQASTAEQRPATSEGNAHHAQQVCARHFDIRMLNCSYKLLCSLYHTLS